MKVVLFLAAVSFATACVDRAAAARGMAPRFAGRGPRPDIVPEVLNTEPPFRYPAALWAQRIQGNVTLRVFVDSSGRALAESTEVATHSGIPALDSAALAGVAELQFRPASLRDKPIGVWLLLPVFFRHPDAPPLPGDSTIKRTIRAP